jgi:hypothetical protein
MASKEGLLVISPFSTGYGPRDVLDAVVIHSEDVWDRADRALHALWVLIAIAALLVVLLIAQSPRSAADPVSAEVVGGGIPVTLRVQGVERYGVIHAARGYSPPGIWVSPSGGPLK